MADNVLVAWKLPSLYKGISAEKCAKEIGDVTTPEQVVDIARDEGAELHKCFEWDDTIAAEKYRVVQAKDVLRSLVIKHVEVPKNEGEEGRITQFRVFENAPEKNVYKSNKWEKIITSIHWNNGDPETFTEESLKEQLANNAPCFTTFGFKKAMCDAVVRFGIDKYSTKFKAAVSMNSKNGLIPFKFSDYRCREELMSHKRGAPILVYINEFGGWEADVSITYIDSVYSLEQIVNIINLTGIGIGIGSGRNAEFGRFKVTGVTKVGE